MPTTRPRHFVTETDELAAALNEAARRWPTLSRSQLITRLALDGHRAAMATRGERSQRRLAAIRARSAMLTGVYGPGYLEDLRQDWPR